MYKQKLNFLVIKIVKRVLFLINGKINSGVSQKICWSC